MTRSELLLAAPCAVAACFVSSTSRAADDVDEAAARVLFAEGRKLAARSDYAAACPKFEESFRLDSGIGTSFNLADCWEHVGRTASAWGRFLSVAAAAKVLGQLERERVARDRAAAIEPMLSHLIVTVSAPEERLTVKRDAIPVGPASWGFPMPVDPGPHVIEATAPHKKAFSVTVTLAPSGDTVTVTIARLESEPGAARVEPPPSEPAAPSVELMRPIARPVSTDARPFRALALTAGAMGVAGLATGAIFGLAFLSVNGDAKTLCPGNTCTQTEKTHHDRLLAEARTDLSVAYIGAGLGVAALATAALVWWRPGPLRPGKVASLRLRPRLLAWPEGLATGAEARW
jgi:hypothetical protein